MASSPSERSIKSFLNLQARKYVGVEFRVLRASNGEVAILPVNPKTGKPEIGNPRKFQVKALWNKMCEHDKVDPKSNFVVFSESNPFAKEYNEAMTMLQEGK